VLKEKSKTSFKDDEEIEAFSDKKEGMDFVSSIWAL
jgi:hypothetical protein